MLQQLLLLLLLVRRSLLEVDPLHSSGHAHVGMLLLLLLLLLGRLRVLILTKLLLLLLLEVLLLMLLRQGLLLLRRNLPPGPKGVKTLLLLPLLLPLPSVGFLRRRHSVWIGL